MARRSGWWIPIVAIWLLLAIGAYVDGSSSTRTYRYASPSAGSAGAGTHYMGRQISFAMSHHEAGWLDREERATEELPERVVDNLELKPADIVADIGAGSGYFTFRIASRVPDGQVIAVDIQSEMLDLIERRKIEEQTGNVQTVLGSTVDPSLPATQIDLVLMVDSYHEFSHPKEMMTAVFDALRPGGRVVLIEYRGEDPEIPIRPLHKMTEAQVRREMHAVGLEFVENRDFLPLQHFLVFRRPA